MLKTTLLLIVSLFYLLDLNAQKEPNIKLKIEAGVLWTSNPANSGFPYYNGLFLNVEPKLKTSKNTFIGLRLGVSVNEQINENYDLLQFYTYNNPNNGIIQFINPDNGIFSIIPTFDYYFITKKHRLYFGGGLGYYFLTNYTDVSPRDMTAPSEDLLEVTVNNQIGFLLRGGLELRKITVGLELNYIPKADIEISKEQKIGTVNNNCIGLSIGYVIGIGKS